MKGEECVSEDVMSDLSSEIIAHGMAGRFTMPQSADAALALWRERMAAGDLATDHFWDHWRLNVPKIYSPHRSLHSTCLDWSWDEEVAEKVLIKPLERFVWGADEAGDSAPPLPRASTYCGRVFKQGETAYSCRECCMDNTCVLCVECFKVSAHRNHKYKMFQSGGGGCCDCGDEEAWRQDPFCDQHKREAIGDESEAERVSEDVIARMKATATAAFAYCFRALALEQGPTLSKELGCSPAESNPMVIMDQPDCFCTVLYNDETHTFEQVITTLTRVMKCNHRDAVELVSHIDRVGRALVKCSSFQICEHLKTDIEKFTTRHGSSLKVLVMHAHLMAHQVFAMKLLTWLEAFVSQEPRLRVALSEVALHDASDQAGKSGVSYVASSGCVVWKVMQNDFRLWKAARAAWHRLFISTMLMDYNTKRALAVIFTKNYGSMLTDFIRDDHDHSYSISSLSVQLYTTPTLAHYLISHHDALYVVFNTFLSECRRRINKQGQLNFDRSNVNTSFKRAQYILYDIKYLLSSVPTVYTDELRRGFLHGVTMLLDLLSMMHGMDSVSRQVGQHMEYEPEWESAFNLHVKLAHTITLALQWCAGDHLLTGKAYRSTVTKLRAVEPFPNTEIKELGEHSASVIPYDVSTKPVSIHLPLSRFAAGLHLLLHNHGMSYHSPIFDNFKPTPEQLIEPVLRTAAMIAQVRAGMWRRNGHTLLNQLYFYHNVKCRAEMLDRDIVMLQIGASLIESNEFIIHMLNKFGLLGWAAADFEETSLQGEDDSMRHTIGLVEEFLGLLIAIIGSRYTPGVGEVTTEDRTKQEIIQALCTKPMAHSELNKALPENELHETGLEGVISKVAVFSKPSNSDERGVYKLKDHLYDEYDAFYYHYTKEELSRSEEAQRNRKKAMGEPECCPPPPLPRLVTPFRLIAQLLQSDAALHVLRTVLARAADLRARSFSEMQVHKALHLIGYAVRDEQSQNYEFVAFAERAQRVGLLDLLQQLLTSARVEAHRPLIQWVINSLRSLLGVKGSPEEGGEKMDTDDSQQKPSTESAEFDKAWRAQMAAARRAKLMAQMQEAQNKFISNNAKLFDETALESEATGEATTPETGAALGVWGGAVGDQARVCIMCQEEARVEAKTSPLVLVAFVQLSTVLNRLRQGTNAILPRGWAEAWLPRGVGVAPHVSSCGHVLHAKCWHKYVDNVVSNEKRRPYRLRQPASFDIDKQEYPCPLCERLCNAVLPLLPNAGVPPYPVPPLPDAIYSQSISLVLNHRVCSEAVHVCTEHCTEMACVANEDVDAMSTTAQAGTSSMESDSESDSTPFYVSTHARPLLRPEFLAHVNGPLTEYNELTKSLILQFSATVHSVVTEPGVSGAAARLGALFRTTSYTILSADTLLQAEGRALLGGLLARHRDTLQTLIRMAASLPSVWEWPKQLAHHAMQSLNTLYKRSPLAYEAFGLLVPLVSSMPSLFATSGPLARSANLSRRITLDLLRATLTRAFIVVDLSRCVAAERMENEEVYEAVPAPEYDGLLELLKEMRNGEVATEGLSASKVWQAVRDECHSFLRCCCIYFHLLSDVSAPAELLEVGGDTWEVMCGYLDLPSSFAELFGSEAEREQALYWAKKEETSMFNTGVIPTKVALDPKEPPCLIPLPEDFSELMNAVAMYACPNSEREDSKYPTMCLVCAKMLCSQSYCCQSELGKVLGISKTADRTNVGASVAHAFECGAGTGLFLRVRDCEGLLLAAPKRGALLPAPYLDCYGETDQGLRRGNPLRLCRERYERLRLVWLSHGVHEQIARLVDTATLLPTVWQHM